MNPDIDLDINIISSSSLFSNHDLDLLQQLNNSNDPDIEACDEDKEIIVEFRNGNYGYYEIDVNLKSNIDKQNTNEKDIKNDDWKLCPMCHEKLQDSSIATSECPKCGAEINNVSEDQDIRKGGNFTGVVQSNYINCDSKGQIKRKLINELKKKTFDSGKHVIPISVIASAVDRFIQISSARIHRGSVQRGLKAMLIKYALDEFGMK